ncbi:MAG: hypothetical protein IT435_02450 [Phycisphaerales bacterium]|nr:hypothetical protein [Phycisphaerales bacterium]
MSENSTTAIELRNKAGEMEVFDYGEYAGQGTSLAGQGNRVPYLSVLQPLSKACTEGDEKYVAGARPGMFLLGDVLFDGKKGVFFIGIEESHKLVEKTSLDGKGETIGEHDPNGPVAKLARSKFGTNKSKWRSEKGHFLVERFDMYGVVFQSPEDIAAMKGLPAICGFERTKLSAREHIMSPFNKLPANKRPPLFAAKIHLSTAFEKGKKGDFQKLIAKFAVNDDFMSSLIRTSDPMWEKWAPQAMEVAKGVRAGVIKADAGKDADDAGEAAGEVGDIPF